MKHVIVCINVLILFVLLQIAATLNTISEKIGRIEESQSMIQMNIGFSAGGQTIYRLLQQILVKMPQ